MGFNQTYQCPVGMVFDHDPEGIVVNPDDLRFKGLHYYTNLLRFVGFGDGDLEPAPPVGFNLTYQCPEGMVFDHDWMARPFVMMTCQVRAKKHF